MSSSPPCSLRARSLARLLVRSLHIDPAHTWTVQYLRASVSLSVNHTDQNSCQNPVLHNTVL
jgi:hypothetical protein